MAFGPIKGSFKDFIKNTKLVHLWVNMIPNQGTKTVKLEEAVHTALSITNLCSLNFK